MFLVISFRWKYRLVWCLDTLMVETRERKKRKKQMFHSVMNEKKSGPAKPGRWSTYLAGRMNSRRSDTFSCDVIYPAQDVSVLRIWKPNNLIHLPPMPMLAGIVVVMMMMMPLLEDTDTFACLCLKLMLLLLLLVNGSRQQLSQLTSLLWQW